MSAKPLPHGAQRGWHPVEWGCELVGTALLLLGGLSAVVFDFGTGSPVASVIHSHALRLLLTGSLFASCGALVTISPLGRRSGAHLNPAVSLAFWCQRHLKPLDFLGYIVAQCVGATAGAFAVRTIWGARAWSVKIGLTQPGPGTTPVTAGCIEAAMTGGLVLVIFGFVSSKKTAHWTPLAVAVLIAVLVWQVAPYTGTSLNPARSLGPAVAARDFHSYVVYVAGPLAGALAAVGLWSLVPLRTLTAKLYHDERYQSIFATAFEVRHRSASVSSRSPASRRLVR